MAIEKRIISGQEIGFNTETNSYFKLPMEREEKSRSIFQTEPEEEKKPIRHRRDREE